MKNKVMAIGVAALLATVGCSTTWTEGDVALLAQDLRDVAREGTIYALAEEPEWRGHVMVVRDQLVVLSEHSDPVTFDSILAVFQGLPLDELKSTEARLAITTARMTLRRAGRNVELGNITQQKPLAKGLADGITEGLNFVPVP